MDSNKIAIGAIITIAFAIIGGSYYQQWNTFKKEMTEYESGLERYKRDLVAKPGLELEVEEEKKILADLQRDGAKLLKLVPIGFDEGRFMGEIGGLAGQYEVTVEEHHSWPPETGETDGMEVKIKLTFKGDDENLDKFRAGLDELDVPVKWTDRGMIQYGSMIMKGTIYYLPEAETLDEMERLEPYKIKIENWLPPFKGKIENIQREFEKMEEELYQFDKLRIELENIREKNRNLTIRREISKRLSTEEVDLAPE